MRGHHARAARLPECSTGITGDIAIPTRGVCLHVLKKAGVVAMAAAGLMLLGSPAFAASGEDYDNGGDSYTAIGEYEHDSEYDEFNFSDYDEHGEGDHEETNILSNINICDIVPIIPILTDDETDCINVDNDNNDNNGDEENVAVVHDK